ncbi:MAG: hypothetical protein ACLU0O_07110 [Collinsella sp.]
MISTNGFFTDRIIDLCEEFPTSASASPSRACSRPTTRSGGLRTATTAATPRSRSSSSSSTLTGFGTTVQDQRTRPGAPLQDLRRAGTWSSPRRRCTTVTRRGKEHHPRPPHGG